MKTVIGLIEEDGTFKGRVIVVSTTHIGNSKYETASFFGTWRDKDDHADVKIDFSRPGWGHPKLSRNFDEALEAHLSMLKDLFRHFRHKVAKRAVE